MTPQERERALQQLLEQGGGRNPLGTQDWTENDIFNAIANLTLGRPDQRLDEGGLGGVARGLAGLARGARGAPRRALPGASATVRQGSSGSRIGSGGEMLWPNSQVPGAGRQAALDRAGRAASGGGNRAGQAAAGRFQGESIFGGRGRAGRFQGEPIFGGRGGASASQAGTVSRRGAASTAGSSQAAQATPARRFRRWVPASVAGGAAVAGGDSAQERSTGSDAGKARLGQQNVVEMARQRAAEQEKLEGYEVRPRSPWQPRAENDTRPGDGGRWAQQSQQQSYDPFGGWDLDAMLAADQARLDAYLNDLGSAYDAQIAAITGQIPLMEEHGASVTGRIGDNFGYATDVANAGIPVVQETGAAATGTIDSAYDTLDDSLAGLPQQAVDLAVAAGGTGGEATVADAVAAAAAPFMASSGAGRAAGTSNVAQNQAAGETYLTNLASAAPQEAAQMQGSVEAALAQQIGQLQMQAAMIEGDKQRALLTASADMSGSVFDRQMDVMRLEQTGMQNEMMRMELEQMANPGSQAMSLQDLNTLSLMEDRERRAAQDSQQHAWSAEDRLTPRQRSEMGLLNAGMTGQMTEMGMRELSSLAQSGGTGDEERSDYFKGLRRRLAGAAPTPDGEEDQRLGPLQRGRLGMRERSGQAEQLRRVIAAYLDEMS